MIKFEVGKRETFGMIDFVDYPNDEFEDRECVFCNWNDKLYASDSRWWAK